MNVRTWQERLAPHQDNVGIDSLRNKFMQAEIDELRQRLGILESENAQRNKLTAHFANKKQRPASEDFDFYPASPFDYAPHPPSRQCDCECCQQSFLQDEVADGQRTRHRNRSEHGIIYAHASRMAGATYPTDLLTCSACHTGTLGPSQALQSTYTGSPDFPDGEVVTMSPGGPGRLVDCLKCQSCGHSVSL